MDALVTHRFRFVGYTLDAKNRILRTAGRDVDLRSKSFDVLCYLVERHGALVSKDEIIGAVWANVSTSDESLTRCISDIRSALEDNERRIIKTVPGRGYVFAAPVSQETGREPASTSAAKASWASLRPPKPSMWVVSTGLIVLLAGVLAIWGLAGPWQAREGLPLPDRPSIAVIPFKNVSGDSGQVYLSDGISKNIATGLSRFRELFVIADNSAAKFKNSGESSARIGRDLGVRYLLQGSVRKYVGRIRITVHLIEARRGMQIWAENYDRPLTNLFAVQEDVTRKIVRRLLAHINQSELERIARKPAANWAAYDFYLRGNAIMKAASKDRKGTIIAAARSAYEKSLAIDRDYAPALQGLALTYWTGWLKPLTDAPIRGEHKNPDVLDRAERLARRSIDLDPTRAEAWATLGWILYWQRGPSAGLGAFERAFKLNPNFVDGRYALLLSHAGRAREAITYMKRAMRLDPLYPLRYKYYLGISFFLTGRNEQALRLVQEVARGLRGFPTGYPILAAVAALTGKMGTAREAAIKVRGLWPNFTISGFVRFMRLERNEDANRLAAGLRKAGLPD